MSIPLKHHYLPVFYLRRWASQDGRLYEFSRPHKEVVARRKYPGQTAYVERLYEMPGLPPVKAQQIEQGFMQLLDSQAAEALKALDNDDPRIKTDSRLRSAWSRFIMSLLLRAPNDIAALKAGVMEEWLRAIPDLEALYASRRSPEDPPTFFEYFATLSPDEVARWAISLAPKLIDHSGIGAILNNMRWLVVRISSEVGEFITSDRPVVMSWTLAEEHAYLFLPIGPKTLFVAVNDKATQKLVEARSPAERVDVTNQFVAGRAINYVYSLNNAPLNLVRKHMGTEQRKSLMGRLAEWRRR
jgi:Protein of unknown function (DUF4238)